MGSPVYLYVTLWLERCPRVLLRHLKAQRQPHLLQAALTSSTRHLVAGSAARGVEVVAIMRMLPPDPANPGAPRELPAVKPEDVAANMYKAVDASSATPVSACV